MRNDLRYKFYGWLLKKVAKVPEGTVPPKWCRMIWAIFYPLEGLYARQSQVRVDYQSGTYIIQGIRLSSEIFRAFNSAEFEGRIFQFVKNENGYVTLKTIDAGKRIPREGPDLEIYYTPYHDSNTYITRK